MSATDTLAVDEHHVAHRDDLEAPVTGSEHELEDGGFISFSESAPLRPFSLPPSTLDAERPSFLSLTPDPALERPHAAALLADSSFLSFTDTPPASSTPDPLSGSETLSVVQEEEAEDEEQEEEQEEQEEDIGGEMKEEEVIVRVGDGDDPEEIDLGDAILLESGRSENVVVDKEAGDVDLEQTGFYYDKDLKRWVPGKKA